MKIKKKTLIQGGAIVVGGVLLFLMGQNYQKDQAAIIAEKQELAARELAVTVENAAAAEAEKKWQIFYDLGLMGVANFQPTQVKSNEAGRMALLDENSQQIIVLGENKKFAQIAVPMSAQKVSAVAWDGGNLVAYAGGLYQYSEKEETWQKLTPDLAAGGGNFLEKFDRNYYLLGANSLQKMTFDKEGQYKTMAEWLADEDKQIVQPLDLWIDGTVYVSEKTSGVSQYLRGEKTKWKLDENLQAPLYMAKNGEEFLILAPQMAAVFRLNAQGEKVAAATDENLRDARFIWLSSDKKQFLTLKGELIYSFALPQ